MKFTCQSLYLVFIVFLTSPLLADAISDNNCSLDFYGTSPKTNNRVFVNCTGVVNPSINRCQLTIAANKNAPDQKNISINASMLSGDEDNYREVFYKYMNRLHIESGINAIVHATDANISPEGLDFINQAITNFCVTPDYRHAPIVYELRRDLKKYSATVDFDDCLLSSTKEKFSSSVNYKPVSFSLLCKNSAGKTCAVQTSGQMEALIFAGTAFVELQYPGIENLEKNIQSEEEFLGLANSASGIIYYCN